jgi:hypothetical protein
MEKTRWLMVIVILIIFSAGGVFAFFLYPEWTPPGSPPVEPSPIPISPPGWEDMPTGPVTEAPTPELKPWIQYLNEPSRPLSDPATYRNEEFGFQLQYPKGWKYRAGVNDYGWWWIEFFAPSPDRETFMVSELQLNIKKKGVEDYTSTRGTNEVQDSFVFNGLEWHMIHGGLSQESLLLHTVYNGYIFSFYDTYYTSNYDSAVAIIKSVTP